MATHSTSSIPCEVALDLGDLVRGIGCRSTSSKDPGADGDRNLDVGTILVGASLRVLAIRVLVVLDATDSVVIAVALAKDSTEATGQDTLDIEKVLRVVESTGAQEAAEEAGEKKAAVGVAAGGGGVAAVGWGICGDGRTAVLKVVWWADG